MTYMALSAGYRGLGYLGDAELTRPAGRALLIEMAFLNEEIDLCESILARSPDPIPYRTAFSTPTRPTCLRPGHLRARKIRPKKEFDPKPGLLVASLRPDRDDEGQHALLVADLAANAQYEAPQMAYRNVVIRPSAAGKRPALPDQPWRGQAASPQPHSASARRSLSKSLTPRR